MPTTPNARKEKVNKLDFQPIQPVLTKKSISSISVQSMKAKPKRPAEIADAQTIWNGFLTVQKRRDNHFACLAPQWRAWAFKDE